MNCANCGITDDSGHWTYFDSFTADNMQFCSCACALEYGKRRGVEQERERIITIYRKQFNGQNKHFINVVAAGAVRPVKDKSAGSIPADDIKFSGKAHEGMSLASIKNKYKGARR